ncbi:MAG: response regulator transcription factor [Candidatus Eremiobacteraeota bacterium]|nr:response regulator transcription factor [Candidatus Eremiobacteraeota bacterium]
MKILVVDDEASILETLQLGLELQGYEVVTAASGRQGLQAFLNEPPDLVILDRMMPDGDGLELCRQIRQRSAVPILMLTALSDVDERVSGLDSGADDYLTKPFKVKELLARIRALSRRHQPPANLLQFADLEVDMNSCQVTRAAQNIVLTAREFQLLAFLVQNPRQMFNKEQLLDRVWGELEAVNLNVVEVHISSLRTKLGDQDKSLIRTVRGLGYCLG